MLSLNTILQNRYRIIRQLGQGGMGTVYEALDQRVSAIVALKETIVGDNEEARRAFEREAALLANLHHQSLSKVMDYFIEDSGEYLVMEYIPGYDLAELLKVRGAPFKVEEVLRWADEILKVLEYLHGRPSPILHRDIKPSNLKLTTQGELFLLDFGLAKGAAGQMPTLVTSRSVRGFTPVYASLEQIYGKRTDTRSDLYSLGATLYHLLTNVPPVDAPTRFDALEDEKPDPLRPAHELNPQVHPAVSAVIEQAMAVSRRHRPSSATEMRQALRRAGEEAQQAVEEERRRQAEQKRQEEEQRRRSEEEERQKRALAEEERRLAEEETARKRAAEEEAARRLAEEQRKREAEEEERRRAAAEVEEADRRRAEEVLRRIEAEAQRRREEQEQRRVEEEARQREEAEAERLRAEEEARQRTEAEAARIQQDAESRAAEREQHEDETLSAVAAQPSLDAPTASAPKAVAAQEAQGAQESGPRLLPAITQPAGASSASSEKVLKSRTSVARAAATFYDRMIHDVEYWRNVAGQVLLLASILLLISFLLWRTGTGDSQRANQNQAATAQPPDGNQASSAQPAEKAMPSPAGLANERDPLSNKRDPLSNVQGASSTNLNSNGPGSESGPVEMERKDLSALRGMDVPGGSRVSVTSDETLNDFEAYRSGDRYYVVIPQANLPVVPRNLRGVGFDDVQAFKRGHDTVLSFRLKPGTAAHVDQKFNRLDVIFTLIHTPVPNPRTSP